MSLVLGSAPFGPRPAGVFNFTYDAPAHRIYWEDHPRRIRAVIDGRVLGETERGKLLHETGIPSVFYFPLDDMDPGLLERTGHTTHCPFKGDAAYYSIRAGDRTAENAVWTYPEPLGGAAWLAGYASVYWDAVDAWFEEDEEIAVHMRDPYHRVDVRRSSRPVRVMAAGEVVAETDRPMLLFETGLPTRYYVPREDVREDLLQPSETQTACPYKGRASYASVRAGDTLLEDVAWFYEEPFPEAAAVTGHVSFLGDGLEVAVGAPEREAAAA